MSNITEAREVIKELDGLLDRLDYRVHNEVWRVYDGTLLQLHAMIKDEWVTEISFDALQELQWMLNAVKALTIDLWKSIKVGDTIEWWSPTHEARVSAKVLEIGDFTVRVDREWCGKPDSKWVNVLWDNGNEVKIVN